MADFVVGERRLIDIDDTYLERDGQVRPPRSQDGHLPMTVVHGVERAGQKSTRLGCEIAELPIGLDTKPSDCADAYGLKQLRRMAALCVHDRPRRRRPRVRQAGAGVRWSR